MPCCRNDGLNSGRRALIADACLLAALLFGPGCGTGAFGLPESLKQVEVPGEGCDRLGEDHWDLRRSPEFAKATKLGDNQFGAVCPGIEKFFVEQRNQDSCWAACAAIVLSYEGTPTAQDSLIEAMSRHSRRDTANDDQIMRAMNLDLEDKVLARFSRVSTAPPMSNTDLITAILAGHPVVLGLKPDERDALGHACVAYAVGFRKLHNNAAIRALGADEWGIIVLEVWDPYPGAGHYTINCSSLASGLQFAVTRDSARSAILKSIEPPRRLNIDVRGAKSRR